MRTTVLLIALGAAGLTACFTAQQPGKRPSKVGLSSPDDAPGDAVTGAPSSPTSPGLSGPTRPGGPGGGGGSMPRRN